MCTDNSCLSMVWGSSLNDIGLGIKEIFFIHPGWLPYVIPGPFNPLYSHNLMHDKLHYFQSRFVSVMQSVSLIWGFK
jgi:hypothetical protein